MIDYLFPLIFCFIVSFITIQCCKPLAIKIGLVDLPNDRKLHSGPIPLVGGLGIYLGVLIAFVVYFQGNYMVNIYFIASALLLFLGVLDDKFDLSVSSRLITQILVALILIGGAGFYFESLGLILGFFELKLGYFGIIITVIAFIASINAFNMVDGIDGLVGLLSGVSFALISVLLYRANNDWYLLSLLFIAAIFAYLMFNLSLPKSLGKIFMGDAGTMLIGLTIIWLIIVSVDEGVNAFRPVTSLYIMAIPLMDMVRLVYTRMRAGGSPFQADRNHLHHIFQRAGLSRKQILLVITGLSSIWAGIGFLSEIYQIKEWIMFSLFLSLFFIYVYCVSLLQNEIDKNLIYKKVHKELVNQNPAHKS